MFHPCGLMLSPFSRFVDAWKSICTLLVHDWFSSLVRKARLWCGLSIFTVYMYPVSERIRLFADFDTAYWLSSCSSFSRRYCWILDFTCLYYHMGVSENSVPLNPMVLLIIIPIKWLFHWEYTLFSDKPISELPRYLFFYRTRLLIVWIHR